MEMRKRLQTDLKMAMREGDSFKRNLLRMMMAAIKQVEIDEKISLDSAGILAILTKQAKQRRETITEAESAGRTELAQTEQAELTIIETYLPKMMSRDEVETVVQELITQLQADSPKDMGKVMGAVMSKLKGKADGTMVSQVVRDLLLKAATP